MLLRELFTNPKRILLEGGNIWPDTSSFDQAYAADLAQEASRYLQGVGAKAHLIGSAATPKPGRMSGDLDVMTDMTHLMNHFKIKDPKEARIQLEKFMQGQGLQTKRTGVTVHIRMPYIGKFYQVDIKAVYNAEKVHLFHVHDIPDNSPYKGVNKQMMMNALATSQNMLWSPDEGLYARDDAGKKAQLLTYELDDVAKYLIGPDATAKDLGSVESIMSAIPDEARRNEIFQLASSGSSWQKTTPINEAASPVVGRKYQHIEDLVFTNGSVGGLHAVERLRHMTTKGKGIELKWDGSPVVYWGRDEHGKFHMFPKNAWDYMKRGTTHTKSGITTIMNDPDDVMNFVMGTGSVQPGQEAKRQAFAQGLAKLWPLFETISPETGFIEGGILFYPDKPAKLNPTTGEYDFTPNITSFHIPSRSELGERIASAQVMVAATGYYTHIGSEEQRYPNAEQLSTEDVIVQGTTYVDQSPQIDNSGLDHVEDYIKKNKAAIDSFVAGQPGLSKPGDVLYSFFNQNLRVEGVKAKFVDWANHKLSSSQAQKVLSHPGLDIILTAVEMLTSQKMKVINALSTGTHSGIRQTKPEGYVQAHPGGKFKNDLPGQFVKTIDQATWAPRKDNEPA
jgi:predicted phosphatase